MREAVIISVARTPIGKAYRGVFNDTQGQELAAHAIRAAVARADIDPAAVEDLVMGSALQQGTTGGNIGRQAALRAGLPLSVPGMTIDRRCGIAATPSAFHRNS
jgi:acetyl-CoA C-acetyltransferase